MADVRSIWNAKHRGFEWRRIAAILPSIGVALLPKLACPACWPAYAGLLSTLGVSVLIDTRYLFALTAVFLSIALVFLGYRAEKRRGYGPLLVGIVASSFLLLGKFTFESNTAMYASIGLLMMASFWNSWPRKLVSSSECRACSPPSPVVFCSDPPLTQNGESS